jgi:hypothetical protein
MSGNVREWCWDWYGPLQGHGTSPEASTPETGRIWRGGGWIGGEHCCESSFRGSFEASGRGPDHGLRVCRSKYTDTRCARHPDTNSGLSSDGMKKNASYAEMVHLQ